MDDATLNRLDDAVLDRLLEERYAVKRKAEAERQERQDAEQQRRVTAFAPIAALIDALVRRKTRFPTDEANAFLYMQPRDSDTQYAFHYGPEGDDTRLSVWAEPNGALRYRRGDTDSHQAGADAIIERILDLVVTFETR